MYSGKNADVADITQGYDISNLIKETVILLRMFCLSSCWVINHEVAA